MIDLVDCMYDCIYFVYPLVLYVCMHVCIVSQGSTENQCFSLSGIPVKIL